MSLERKRSLKCDNCGKEFEVEVYDSINVSLNPELKGKVIDGSIYSFVCPYCGEEHYIQYPFLYHDMEHGFMIQSGTLIELIDYYDNVVNGKVKKVSNEFPGFFDNIKQLGVTSYRELRSKIVMLENGLDYRIATLYCIFMEQQYRKIIEMDKNLKEQKAYVCDSFFIMHEGKPVVIIDIDLNDENHTHKTPGDELDMELYHNLENAFMDKVNSVFNFCFNRDIGYKLLNIDDKDIGTLKSSNMEIAVVDIIDGDEILTFVPEFNEGKFKKDDMVCVMKSHRIAKGKIQRIFHMDCYTLPIDLDDMPVVAYKTQDIELTTTGSSNDELDNSKLKEMFEVYNKKGRLDEGLVSKSNIIIGSITTMEMADWLNPDNLDEFVKAIADEDGNLTIPISSMKTKLLTYKLEDQDAKLLCVYLEQKELTNSEASRMIYNFDDVIRVVLNNPEKYDGIIVNPETDKILISNKRLVRYKYEKVMTDSDKMRELLPILKPEEISYIGQFNYDMICKVYKESTNPKKIADELGKEEKEIGDALDTGYEALIHIVIDNY